MGSNPIFFANSKRNALLCSIFAQYLRGSFVSNSSPVAILEFSKPIIFEFFWGGGGGGILWCSGKVSANRCWIFSYLSNNLEPCYFQELSLLLLLRTRRREDEVTLTPAALSWGTFLRHVFRCLGSNPAFSAKERRNFRRVSNSSQFGSKANHQVKAYWLIEQKNARNETCCRFKYFRYCISEQCF